MGHGRNDFKTFNLNRIVHCMVLLHQGKEATVSNIMDAPTTPKPSGNTLPVLDDDTGPVLFENTRVAIANSAQAAGLLKSVILPHRKPNDVIGSPDIVPPLPLNDEVHPSMIFFCPLFLFHALTWLAL